MPNKLLDRSGETTLDIDSLQAVVAQEPMEPVYAKVNTGGEIIVFAALLYAICSGDGFPRRSRFNDSGNENNDEL